VVGCFLRVQTEPSPRHSNKGSRREVCIVGNKCDVDDDRGHVLTSFESLTRRRLCAVGSRACGVSHKMTGRLENDKSLRTYFQEDGQALHFGIESAAIVAQYTLPFSGVAHQLAATLPDLLQQISALRLFLHLLSGVESARQSEESQASFPKSVAAGAGWERPNG